MFDFGLPTDLFDGGHVFFGRGLSLLHSRQRLRLQGFVGTTSTSFTNEFFQAASSNRTQGLLLLDYDWTKRVHIFSRNVFSDSPTTIHRLEWRPRQDLQMALGAGMGASHPYFSSGVSLRRNWVALKGSYVAAGEGFRRVAVPPPIERPETNRENVLLELRPSPFLTIRAEHENLVAPRANEQQNGLKATVNTYSAAMSLKGFRLGGALFESSIRGARSRGDSFFLGRRLGGRLDTQFNFLRSSPARGLRTNTITSSFRELLSPRLSLLQVVTHSDGQNTVSFGGDFTSNRLTAGVGYQTLYFPFGGATQFRQTLELHFRLRLFGNAHLAVDTNVEPDGSVKYSVSSGTFLYRQQGLVQQFGRASFSFPKYMIRGSVTDPKGHPISGAAVRIGSAVVYSDPEGKFFIRESKSRSYPLEVLVKEFLMPGTFEVVSEPKSARAERDGSAQVIKIIVRRLAAPPHSPNP